VAIHADRPEMTDPFDSTADLKRPEIIDQVAWIPYALRIIR